MIDNIISLTVKEKFYEYDTQIANEITEKLKSND